MILYSTNDLLSLEILWPGSGCDGEENAHEYMYDNSHGDIRIEYKHCLSSSLFSPFTVDITVKKNIDNAYVPFR